MTINFKSNNHVNILNLLTKCENRFSAKNNTNKPDWRLENYVKSIFKMLEHEENKTGILDDELVAARRKAQFFHGLLEAQSKETVLERYSSINLLQTNILTEVPNEPSMEQLSTQTKMIHRNQLVYYERQMKEELFQNVQNSNRRNVDETKTSTSTTAVSNSRKINYERNFNDIIKYHQLLQEKVTNEMVELVRNLKQNAATSNEIVKKDTELLEKTNRFTDTVTLNLKKNTDKIKEFANMACEYWLWISLFIVTFTFLFMVVFIRLFPKRPIVAENVIVHHHHHILEDNNKNNKIEL